MSHNWNATCKQTIMSTLISSQYVAKSMLAFLRSVAPQTFSFRNQWGCMVAHRPTRGTKVSPPASKSRRRHARVTKFRPSTPSRSSAPPPALTHLVSQKPFRSRAAESWALRFSVLCFRCDRQLWSLSFWEY